MSSRFRWLIGCAALLCGMSTALGAPPVLAAAPAFDDADELVEKAMNSNNPETALKHIEAALEADPKHRKALFLLAAIKQQEAQVKSQDDRPGSIPAFLKSAEAARTLWKEHKDLDENERALVAMALYNEACSLAIDGKTEPAMKALIESFDAGFNEMELFRTDKELDALREMPEFKELVASLAKKSVEQAESLLAENKPFPFTFKLPGLDGKPLALDSLKGKVVIVDFWGTWCGPCRREIPHLVDLYKTYQDDGLEIVGINYEQVDDEQVIETIEEGQKELGITYPCVIGDEKTQDSVPDFEGYPTTLFLDRAGKVRLKLVGYTEKDELEAIIKLLLEDKGTKPEAN